MSNFTKAGSEDWQSTLTRAPLFANLFFDRLAALGSRAVNAPFRGLCFVALFDQMVDCRLLARRRPCGVPPGWRVPMDRRRTGRRRRRRGEGIQAGRGDLRKIPDRVGLIAGAEMDCEASAGYSLFRRKRESRIGGIPSAGNPR